MKILLSSFLIFSFFIHIFFIFPVWAENDQVSPTSESFSKAIDLLDSSANSVLVFGGSFFPPTLEHLSLLIFTMRKFDIKEGYFRIALPYKKGEKSASDPQIPVDLTIEAVKNFDYVLRLLGIRNFHFRTLDRDIDSGGDSTKNVGIKLLFEWTEPSSNKTYKVGIDTGDIDRGIRENTLETFKHLVKVHKGKKIFWLSGMDSFASIPKWFKDDVEWKKLFTYLNFIVTPRVVVGGNKEGFAPLSDNMVSFLSEKFVTTKFPALSIRTGSRETPYEGLHVALLAESTIPSIPFISSSAVRSALLGSLKKDFDKGTDRRKDASDGSRDRDIDTEVFEEFLRHSLPPRVLMKIIQNPEWISGATTNSILSLDNLAIVLEYLFHEKNSGNMDEVDQKIFDEIVFQIIQRTRNQIETDVGFFEKFKAIKDKPIDKASIWSATYRIWDSVTDKINIRKMISQGREMIEQNAVQYGMWLVLAYVIAETIEEPASIAISYEIIRDLFGDTLGKLTPVVTLVFSQAFHQEYITIPTGLAIYFYYKKRRQWQMVGGNKKLFKDLLIFEREFVPETLDRVLLYAELNKELGIADDRKLPFQVVRSEYPSMVPLVFRKQQDKKYPWYSLNVSVNELVSIVGKDVYAEFTKKYKDPAIRSWLLLNYIMSDSGIINTKFFYFFLRRYLLNLHNMEVPHAALDLLSAEERNYVSTFKKFIENNESSHNKAVNTIFNNVVSDIFIFNKLSLINPEFLSDADFWNYWINLIIKEYPDKKVSVWSKNRKNKLIERIVPLAAYLSPMLEKDLVITYKGKDLFTIKAAENINNDVYLTFANPSWNRSYKLYLEKNRSYFSSASSLLDAFLNEFNKFYRNNEFNFMAEGSSANNFNFNFELSMTPRFKYELKEKETLFEKLDNLNDYRSVIYYLQHIKDIFHYELHKEENALFRSLMTLKRFDDESAKDINKFRRIILDARYELVHLRKKKIIYLWELYKMTALKLAFENNDTQIISNSAEDLNTLKKSIKELLTGMYQIIVDLNRITLFVMEYDNKSIVEGRNLMSTSKNSILESIKDLLSEIKKIQFNIMNTKNEILNCNIFAVREYGKSVLESLTLILNDMKKIKNKVGTVRINYLTYLKSRRTYQKSRKNAYEQNRIAIAKELEISITPKVLDLGTIKIPYFIPPFGRSLMSKVGIGSFNAIFYPLVAGVKSGVAKVKNPDHKRPIQKESFKGRSFGGVPNANIIKCSILLSGGI